MSKKDLTSELVDKGLLDDETIDQLNSDFCKKLEREIEAYKSTSNLRVAKSCLL